MIATEQLIDGDELHIEPSGTAAIRLRLPWYRSLAPSTIEDIAVSVSGVTVPSEQLTVEINGRSDDLPTIAGRWEETWFVQDRAIVRFPTVLVADGTAEVSASITLRIPYILTGPDAALKRTTQESRTLTVVKEEQP